MESQNITIDPQTDFKEGKAEPLSVPLENTLQRSSRIKKIQTTAMILLFLAAVINYLDRSSLSVANLTIREELGLRHFNLIESLGEFVVNLLFDE